MCVCRIFVGLLPSQLLMKFSLGKTSSLTWKTIHPPPSVCKSQYTFHGPWAILGGWMRYTPDLVAPWVAWISWHESPTLNVPKQMKKSNIWIFAPKVAKSLKVKNLGFALKVDWTHAWNRRFSASFLLLVPLKATLMHRHRWRWSPPGANLCGQFAWIGDCC